MAKSVFAERMDVVQSVLAENLKAAGFRRRGRTFNRSEEDGVVQVVNFQMWPAPIGGGASLLGNDKRYGTFAVNVGVYIAEVHAAAGLTTSSFPKDVDCAIRTRLEDIVGKPNFAWSLRSGFAGLLKPKLDAVAASVWQALGSEGLAFLERFSTREKIIKGWIDEQPNCVISRPARIDVAIILAARGDKAGAADMLDEHVGHVDPQRPVGPRHVEHVRELAIRLGLRNLAAWPPEPAQ